MDVRFVTASSQYIHYGGYDQLGNFRFWLTAIYAQNHLEARNILWRDLTTISTTHQGLWSVVGDFNIVAKINDRMSGRLIIEAEYVDYTVMLNQAKLY